MLLLRGVRNALRWVTPPWVTLLWVTLLWVTLLVGCSRAAPSANAAEAPAANAAERASSAGDGAARVAGDASAATASVVCTEPRPTMCTHEYRPVCADVDTGIRCIRAPCPSTERREFPNACDACSKGALAYVPGHCPDGG